MLFDVLRNRAKETSGVPQIRVVFMGTPDFAAAALRKLLDTAYHVVAVYTQPDKPVGRKQEMTASPVKLLAVGSSIPVEQPARFDQAAIDTLRQYKPDVIIVAAYGKILPKEVLDIPGFGCVNIHGSLLPRWRGASPVQNALLSGDEETGITIMLMDEGMDTGPILAQLPVPIAPDDTSATLLDRLASAGADFLIETLPLFIRRKIEVRPQPETGATLCQLIERDDGRILWNETAETIWNQYRGLSPWPGVFTFWKVTDGEFVRLKLTRIALDRADPAPRKRFGEVFEYGEKIGVQTGSGVVFIESLQPSGKDEMTVRDFLNGRKGFLGSILE